LLCAVGCNKSPFDRTQNVGGGPTGTITPGGSFVIFNNELVSGGGAFEYPGSDGQNLVFNDTSNPISQRSIRYSWTGQLVAGQNFAGFDLMDQPTQAQYNSQSTGRDLSKAGYGKVTFFARGSLSTNTLIKIEVADDGNSMTHDANCLSLSTNGTLDAPDGAGANCNHPQTLTSNWQSFSIPVTNASLIGLKDFFKATYIFLPSAGAPTGQGGTVYFDVIQYQP